MRAMPRVLLLLFMLSVLTMMFVARCGLNMDAQLHQHPTRGVPLPVVPRGRESSANAAAVKTSDVEQGSVNHMKQVLRQREVQHNLERSQLEDKIRTLEGQLRTLELKVNHTNNNNSIVGGGPGYRWAFQGSNHAPPIQQPPSNDQLSWKAQQEGKETDKNGDVDIGNNYNNDNAKGNINNMGFINRNINNNNVNNANRNSNFAFNNKNNNNVQQFNTNNNNNNNNNNLGFGNNNNRLFNSNRGLDEDNHNIGTNPLNNIKMGLNNNNNNIGLPNNNVGLSNNMELANNNIGLPNNNNNIGASGLNNNMVTNMSSAVSQLQDITSYFSERLQSAEVLKGFAYKTEYEVPSFNRFTLSRIYLVEPGLGKRVIEKPIGAKKKDLFEIIAYGIDSLNANRTHGQALYGYEDFVEGIYRTEPSAGTHYELYFQNRDAGYPIEETLSSHAKVVVFRPFGPPMVAASGVTFVREQWINLILPLSGRLDTFRHFIERFVTVCIQQDKRVYLTVVYFGNEGLKEVKSLMSAAAKQHKYKHMKLITLNEKFARGRGLQIGALNWKSGDVLLFFCDVDVIFGQDFLERCRSNAEQERRVYYPMVFSLYNPKIVYALHDMAIPALADQLIISKDTGFWRDFGYGMTCQYRSDFLKIKGFDEQIQGWGGEDVMLYQKFVKSDQYQVMRVPDPGIFHLWHEKQCDPALSHEQYRSCIRSKALNEASHSQLGLLAFKDELDVHRSVLNRAEIKEQLIV